MVTYGYLKQNPDGHSSCLVVPIIGIPAKGFKKQPKFNSLCFIQAEYSFLTISDVKNSIIVNRIRHCSIQFTAELKQEFICRLSSRLESSLFFQYLFKSYIGSVCFWTVNWFPVSILTVLAQRLKRQISLENTDYKLARSGPSL